jgi:phage tail-like protein
MNFLDYLPSIYRDDAFLARFLRIFEDVVAPVELTLENVHHYFDPRMTPETLLPWLATWVDLSLDENWPIEKRRQLIRAGVELYQWRGTRRGLHEYLRIYTGVDPEIIEHFGAGDGGPHRFTVVVTVADPDDLNERTVRRVINAEKPAHTTYELRIRREGPA